MSLTPHERNVKRKLVEVTKAIRKKMRNIRSNVNESEDVFQKTFKPIIEPLTEVATAVKAEKSKPPVKRELTRKIELQRETLQTAKQKLESTPYIKREDNDDDDDDERFFDIEESIHSKASEYLGKLRETPQLYDTQYGPRFEDGKVKIGNAEVKFDMKSITLLREGSVIGQFEISPELLHVLFTNTNPVNISLPTKKVYAQILDVTNAIRKKYEATSGIQGTRSIKYTAFIKPILDEYILLSSATTPSRPRRGEGINKYLTPQVQYRWWDSPKELVDRLRLLWASRQAGNNSHHNEIVAILEELREAGVIY